MYDPSIGRWISEDPIGFQAADPNLYRYVGNDPTGETDPSGLQGRILTPERELAARNRMFADEQLQGIIDANRVPDTRWIPANESYDAWRTRTWNYLPLDEFFRARIHFEGIQPSTREIAKRILVRERLSQALLRIMRAELILRNHWPRVQQRFRDAAELSILFQGNNRQFYIDAFARIYDRFRGANNTVNFTINADNGEPGQLGYVNRRYLGYGPIIDMIYLNPLFFHLDNRVVANTAASLEREQVVLLIHELGRLIPGLTGNANTPLNSTNNMLNWRNVVMILSDRRDELTRP